MITALQQFPPVVLSLFSFAFAYGFVLLFGYLAGKKGLYAVLVLLVVAANIQVLKTTQYGFFKHPVALGTELFAATYLATDILTEIYKIKAAIGGIILSFLAMLFWAIFSILTLGFKPINTAQAGGDEYMLGMHEHLRFILEPAPAILIASVLAFLVSQFLDTVVFSAIRSKTGSKLLWLRNNVSTIVAAIVDNTIFSVLAWIILSRHPLPINDVIKTYILGTLMFRIIAALLDTPLMYLAKKVMNPEQT